MNNDNFSYRIKEIIKSVPKGKVATYGQIATIAGHPKGARLVSYILHSSSKKDKLPWHRIVNRKGMISLREGFGYEIQYQLLKDEGISFNENDSINLKKFGWKYEITDL